MPLKTDYTNDILNTDVNVERKYVIKDNNGSVVVDNATIEDVTAYTREGSRFGANDMNATNTAVNELNDSLNEINSFSNEESRCGKWYGADLYSKCFEINNISSGSQPSISIEPAIVRNLKRLDGTFFWTNFISSCNIANNGATAFAFVDTASNELYVQNKYGSTINKAIITLYYTKS